MLLVILATLLVLAIAFYLTLQGLFSAVIMCLLSVLAAVIALNYYEPFGQMFYPGHAAYGNALALTLLFSLPLLVARLGLDYFVRANVVFGQWVDRIVSGLVGMVAGTVVVGILMLVLQMLPFGASVLSYRPFNDSLQRTQTLRPFNPDDAVLAIGRGLSNGSLSAQREFSSLHEDLLLQLFCNRNRADLPCGFETDPDALKIEGVYQLAPDDEWAKAAPPNPLLSDEENQATDVVIIRTVVSVKACDEDGWWRLPATQFRLAWPDGRSFYPVAFMTSPWGGDAKRLKIKGQKEQWVMWTPPTDDDGKLLYAKLAVLRPRKYNKINYRKVNVDWVFRLPQQPASKPAPPNRSRRRQPTVQEEPLEDLRPLHMVFRQSAEARIPQAKFKPGRPPKPLDDSGDANHNLPLSHKRLRRR